MKAFLSATLSWTLSFLLAWEPFALAASKTFDADLKNFVTQTGLTQKRLTLNELYKLNYGFLPKDAREGFKPDAQMGNYLLPKFDVTRVKGPDGEEAYQFSASQDGKAISFMIVNGPEKIFLRVNGQNVSLSDHITLAEYFKKFGLNDQQIAQTGNNRGPASSGGKLLSAEQIMRMGKAQQIKYFKQLRDLMQSMEETQNAMGLGGKKTSSDARVPSDKYSILFVLLNPDAQAQSSDNGHDCVAAGYTSTVSWNSKRIDPQTGKVVPGYSCGSDGNGGVPAQYRGSCTQQNQFLCNPVLYGDGGGHALCAPAGADTTKFCNTIVKGNDIPDLSKNRDEFNALKSKAEAQATLLLNACAANKFQADQIRKDQAWTCQNLRERYTTVESWNCANADFAKGYPKLCKDSTFNPPQAPQPPVAEQPPVAPQPPQPPVTPPSQSPDGSWYCDSLPGDMFYPQINTCPMPGADPDQSATCLDRKSGGPLSDKTPAMPATLCKCVSGSMTQDFRCSAQPGNTADGSDSSSHHHAKKTPPPKPKGPNWWVIFGAGLAGAYLLYRIDKSSQNQSFNYLAGVATSTSTTTSTSTVTTLPAPRVLNGVR